MDPIPYASQGPDERTSRTRDIGIIVFALPSTAIGTAFAWPDAGSVSRLLFWISCSSAVGLVTGWAWSAILLSLVRKGWRKTWTAGFVGAGVGALSLLTLACSIFAVAGAFDRDNNDMAEFALLIVPALAIAFGSVGGFGLGGIAGWLVPDSVVRREAAHRG